MANNSGYIKKDILGVGKTDNISLNVKAPNFRGDVEGFKQATSVSFADLDTKFGIVPRRDFNRSGFRYRPFSELFYNRITVEPLLFEVGNLVTEKTTKIIISNLFFLPVTLTSIQATDSEGVFVTGHTLPAIIKPLSSITFDVKVTLLGSPTINAFFLFSFDKPEQNKTFNVTGSRIVLYPYEFRSGMIESMQWQTEILKSVDGTEQRIKIFESPRQQLKIQSFLNHEELIRMSNLFYGWRTRGWAVSMMMEARKTTVPVLKDQNLISVSTKFARFKVGGLAAIYRDSRNYDTFEIIEMGDNYLKSRQNITNDYQDGASVMPVEICRMMKSPSRSTIGHNAVSTVNFEVVDNYYNGVVAEASIHQFLGYDLWVDEVYEILSQDGSRDDLYEQKISIVDYLTGKLTFEGEWKNTEISFSVRFIIEGLEEIWNFKAWLRRMSGMNRPFWMSTNENDIQIVTEDLINVTIKAKNNDFQTMANKRKHVLFRLKNGTFFTRTIIAFDVDNDGRTLITFDQAINLFRDDIESISYLGICRFDQDNIDLTWTSNEKIICDVSVREIAPNVESI